MCGALKRARLAKLGVAEVVFVRKEDAVNAYRKYNNRCLDGESHTHSHTDTHTLTHTHRQTDTHTHTHRLRHTHTHTDTLTHTLTNRHTRSHTHRHTHTNKHSQTHTLTHITYTRVRTVMKNLEKSWNFKTAISRPGKVLENLGNLFDKSLYNTIMFIRVLNFGTGLRMGYIAYFYSFPQLSTLK